MLQTAVFVDAGYLYAQGSALVAGSKQPRRLIRLNVPPLIASLLNTASAVEPNARLLRIYWYDGLTRGGSLNLDQRAVAEAENVKCRFGTINSRGEQKGVDSLIVTDLIELSRTHAISDALIIAGDEDLRVGVQVAQSFGIRVHLLGIQPSRGSQSPDLIAEADTTREWDLAQVGTWMTVLPEQPVEVPPANILVDAEDQWMDTIVAQRIVGLSQADAQAISDYVDENRSQLPADFDRPSLAMARDGLGRELTNDERRNFRVRLREAVKQRAVD